MSMTRRFAMAVLLALWTALAPAQATVNSSTNRIVVLGNGVQTQFAFNFIGVGVPYISVILTDAGGTETPLTLGAGSNQYQLVLNPPVAGAIWGLGGTVTYNPGGVPIPSGSTLTILRTLPLTQAITLQNQASVAALGKGAETGIDTGVMQAQQINEKIGRAILANVTNLAPPLPLPPAAQIANLGLCADASGNNIVGCSLAPNGIISSAMQPVVSAATLALGRAAFGLGSIAVESIGGGLEDDGAGNVRTIEHVVQDSSNQAAGAAFHQTQRIASGPLTYTLARANTLFNGFSFTVTALTGSITFAPDANDNFPGLSGGASFIIPAGATAQITTDAATTGTWYISLLPQVLSLPQGYVTPCPAAGGVTGCTAGALLPTGDVTAVSTLYYTPAAGNQIPVYNGAQTIMLPFPELSLTLNASHLANTIYDICVFSNGGIPTLVTAPAWQTSTPGSSVRGVPAAIARINGIFVNNLAITGRNGATTYAIPANQCTMVATGIINAAAGQMTFTRTYGQSRNWAVWNFDNGLDIELLVGDSSASWTTASTVFAPSHSLASNAARIVIGQPQDQVSADFVQQAQMLGNSAGPNAIAIGYNVTNAACGLQGAWAQNNGAGQTWNLMMSAQCRPAPFIGAAAFTALERASTSTTMFGTNLNMLLSVRFRG